MQDPNNCGDIIKEAASIILEGGLVVYPTDTSYGLACDPRLEEAMERLVNAKRREKNLGIPLLFSDLAQCEMYHHFGSLEKILAKIFWPGALTLVVTASEAVPKHVTVGRDSIAVRVPDHVIPRGLANEIGAPIAGTSANISGGDSPFNVNTAIEQLGEVVDLYIDGGPSKSKLNSTIVGIEETGISGEPLNIKVYREGEISIEQLTDRLKVDSDALKFWTTRVVYADK
ncbi:MAG: threonylcarbamoyl-AMP synthase [Candidatus Thorarchaeota archaeon]|nr:threonylcarbamoyl-AMP synthase [Candidatus Thorarchaeota archaeon]